MGKWRYSTIATTEECGELMQLKDNGTIAHSSGVLTPLLNREPLETTKPRVSKEAMGTSK